MARIALVQPMTNIFDAGKKLPTPPISLLCAARYLHPDHDVRIVDVRIDKDWRGTLARLIDEGVSVVGTHSITGDQIFSALDVTRFVKSVKPNLPVIWGGIHGTLFPDQVLEEPSVNYVVRFEGEHTFRELVDTILDGGDVSGVAGVSRRIDGQNLHNAERPFVSMDELPDIPFELLRRNPWFLVDGKPTVYMETSRGCQSACTYCYNNSYHKRSWRGQKAETVLGVLDRLHAKIPEVKHLSFVDDNFFGARRRTAELLDGLIARGAPFTYQVQGAHIGVVGKMEREDFERLRASGCVRLDMGAESGSETLLRQVLKITSPERILRINAMCREVGITPWFNLMTGMPQETENDLRLTIDLGLRITRENPRGLVSPFYIYAPYPGTNLFATAEQLGFAPPKSINDWRGLHSGDRATPWLNKAGRQLRKSVYFLSIFIDRKLEFYDSTPLTKLAARLYRPIARLRMKYRFFRLMPEKYVFFRAFNIS
ncbi:B12-binding domain-containing radical SAM protein [bacterium]|nr:B12-binding domain-containing radical SAM protein [bacterium]